MGQFYKTYSVGKPEPHSLHYSGFHTPSIVFSKCYLSDLPRSRPKPSKLSLGTDPCVLGGASAVGSRPERRGGRHIGIQRGGRGPSGHLPAASHPSTFRATPAGGSRRREPSWPAKAAPAIRSPSLQREEEVRPGGPAGGEMDRSNALAINMPMPSIREAGGPHFGSVVPTPGPSGSRAGIPSSDVP